MNNAVKKALADLDGLGIKAMQKRVLGVSDDEDDTGDEAKSSPNAMGDDAQPLGGGDSGTAGDGEGDGQEDIPDDLKSKLLELLSK